jgi:hypothetical protein
VLTLKGVTVAQRYKDRKEMKRNYNLSGSLPNPLITIENNINLKNIFCKFN